VSGAKSGDNLFLHYSGHGAQTPDLNHDEEDGFDETLVPCDYERSGQIVDDEIHDIVCKSLPKGVRLTAVMDCCHSGSLLDLEYVWHSEASTIPLRRRAQGNALGLGSGAGGGAFQKENKKHCQADIMLLSGCRDSQTSADVKSIESFHHQLAHPGKSGGACTNALAEILTTELKRQGGNLTLTFVELLDSMQKDLARRQFSQVPQLSTSRPIDIRDQFSLCGPL
jgi:hypothetical protein